MTPHRRYWFLHSGVWIACACVPARADDRVINSKHDLSAFGPGPVRAVNESEVCVFCHTPHNASPAAPLWNRYSPQTHYRIYRSSTIDARVDQPGLPSKLCLSCHDGSVALGMVLSRSEPIPMTHPFIPTGPTNLTNDLSDDHPVGLRYDRALANRDRQIRSPDLVDHRIALGPLGQLECTACHDPHNNELGDFLRLPLQEGALCNTCHQMSGWRESGHAHSPLAVPVTLTNGQPLPFHSMADNACLTCHVAHGAAQKERLLRARAYDLCIGCHNGWPGLDILSVIGRRSGHRPQRVITQHDPAEDPRFMRPHVDCVDCHNPHAAQPDTLGYTTAAGRVEGPLYKPTMQHVPGVSLSGLPVAEAQYYYEVCFRCHADNPVPLTRRIVRVRDDGGNIRRDFLPTVASGHPVAYSIRNLTDVPSLTPEARTRPYMNCQDCHNNPDARELGGGGPNGPHGSRYEHLLADRYDTADLSFETPQTYALCYRCHDRNSILGDESFSLHRRHVVNGRSPCSACHAPHGVTGSRSAHGHLINFDVSIVSGRREYVSRARRSGSCTLTCHGVQHVNFVYGP